MGRKRAVSQELCLTNVAREHCVAGVSGLLADAPGRDARLSGAGGEPSAKTVPRIARRIEASRCNSLPDDQAHGFGREALAKYSAMPIDPSEDRAFFAV
jgi:hypothetical protein